MVVVVCLVAVDGDEVLARVGCQFTVEVCGRDDGVFVRGEAFGRFLHDGEHFGHILVELVLVFVEYFLLQLVYLGEDVGALVDGSVLDSGLELGYLVFLLGCRALYVLPYCG